MVSKDDKCLLFIDLAGSKSEDGTTFSGRIIIPSEFVEKAEILILDSYSNSMPSFGVERKLKVGTFKRIMREKSWTDQK
jgi:hypothetical protein